MCYPKPGPRCSGHTLAKLNDAKEALRKNPSDPVLRAKVEKAQMAYNTTPDGIAALRESGQSFQADIAEAKRAAQLSAYKKVLAVEADAEVPPREKSQYVGNDHLNDDILGIALDGSRDAVDGYTYSSDYKQTDDGFNVTLTWMDKNDDGSYAYGFLEQEELGEFNRPTEDEAEEIADRLNNEAEEYANAYDDFDSSEAHESIARNLASTVYKTDEPSDEQVREMASTLTITDEHDFVRLTAADVLNSWDARYGE